MKSNSPVFEVGVELTGNVTFKDFLDRIRRENPGDITFEKPKAVAVPEFIEPTNVIEMKPKTITIDELIAKAEANGFKRADIVTGARIYHNQPNLYHLRAEQAVDLDKRMTARIEKMKGETVEEKNAAKKKVA